MAAKSFGRYELLNLLGRGGMGEVYRAHDTVTERIVAIKLLPADLAGDSEFEQRFRREARTAAGLNDPHVVPIHNYGEIDGRLYVDMRLIEGRDLGTLIADDGGRLNAVRAVTIIDQIATALDSAHRAGLVHRDVKPSNILVGERDFAYLIDFGIARANTDTAVTKTGHMIGTLAYMAPERFEGTADSTADVYSLACVLYECLTGDRPFPGDSLQEQLARHLTAPPPKPSATRPDLPPAFDAVIARGMAKSPAERYQTTSELADAAKAALTGTLAAPRPTFPPQPPTLPAPLPHTATAPVPKARRSGLVQPPRSTTPTANEQRREAAKGRLDEQLQRQAEEARKRRIIIGGAVAVAVVLVAVVLVVALSGHDQSSGNATPTTGNSFPESTVSATSSTTQAAPTPSVSPLPPFKPSASVGANCQYPASPDAAAKPVKPPTHTGKIPTDQAQVSASMVTSQGNIGLLLANNESPCTVNSFASLIGQKYFDNTKCHRLTTSPELGVLQCGDPKGDGTGGPGYGFGNEYPTDQYPPNDPKLQEAVVYPRGTLAMANAGPNTNGSQFFMVYKDSQLPPQYTVFGTIQADGLATLDNIAKAGVAGGGEDGAPTSEVTIKSLLLD